MENLTRTTQILKREERARSARHLRERPPEVVMAEVHDQNIAFENASATQPELFSVEVTTTKPKKPKPVLKSTYGHDPAFELHHQMKTDLED